VHQSAVKLSAKTLEEASISGMQKYFREQTQHRPSEKMYDALKDIIKTLVAMADQRADPVIYLSSLDPGVGKTTAVTAFVQALMADPGYANVGVMICVARLDEIKGMIARMGIPRESLAVLTSDPEVNELGGAQANNAQVLFTTQQRLEKHLDGGSFSRASEFFYQDRPRDVRVWDETWLPGVGVMVSRDDISSMLKYLRPHYPELTDYLETLFIHSKEMKNGSRIDVPDFDRQYQVDLNTALSLFDGPQSLSLAVTSLWHMSGRTIVLRNDDAYGRVMLTYRQTLPDDLSPMIVLDASGRVRQTYPEMKRHRKNIRMLRPAIKRYDNLNLHLWCTGAGKTSWSKADKFEELVDGITSTILKKPDEEWLIVVHKAGGKIRNIESAVVDRLGESFDVSKLHFINWGRHMATNEFATVPNVILAGTLFYRPSHYEALGRLAADRHPSLEYSTDDQKRIAQGEHLHGILQALCRASVRRCQGDVCAPCNAYVIASVNSGIPDALAKVFPGARIRDWRPVGRVLKGKVKEALAYIDKCLSQGQEVIRFTDVMKAIGMKSSSNFRSDIRQHPDFMAELSERWIKEDGNCRMTHFRLITAEYLGFVDEE